MSQHELNTLLELKQNPSINQRSLPRKLKLSLGLTNSILKNLISWGWVKAKKDTEGIGVFGSYVRGEYKGKSDLDILVEFEEDADVDLLKFVNMENYLSELMGVKVDLVIKEAVKPRLKERIFREVEYV